MRKWKDKFGAYPMSDVKSPIRYEVSSLLIETILILLPASNKNTASSLIFIVQGSNTFGSYVDFHDDVMG